MPAGCTVKMIRMRTGRHLVVEDFVQRSGSGWGLALTSVLAAAVAAGCFAFAMWPPPTETNYPKLPSHAPQPMIQDKGLSAGMTRPGKDEEKAVEAFQRAADAILSRAANMSASAPVAGRPVGVKVPLPRRRPIASP